MKIGVIAANGRVGQKVVKIALDRGDDVTAIIRHRNQTNAKKFLQKDLFDLTTNDLKDFDVVVDAFGVWEKDQLDKHQTSLNHLTKILANTNVRLIVVGGAGSLYVDKNKGIKLMDTPDFPKDFKPLAEAMGKALEDLKKVKNVCWTYLSPAADFQAEGQIKDRYVLADDQFTTDKNGISAISYEDYAKALVDEIHNDKYEQQQISVRW